MHIKSEILAALCMKSDKAYGSEIVSRETDTRHWVHPEKFLNRIRTVTTHGCAWKLKTSIPATKSKSLRWLGFKKRKKKEREREKCCWWMVKMLRNSCDIAILFVTRLYLLGQRHRFLVGIFSTPLPVSVTRVEVAEWSEHLKHNPTVSASVHSEEKKKDTL